MEINENQYFLMMDLKFHEQGWLSQLITFLIVCEMLLNGYVKLIWKPPLVFCDLPNIEDRGVKKMC